MGLMDKLIVTAIILAVVITGLHFGLQKMTGRGLPEIFQILMEFLSPIEEKDLQAVTLSSMTKEEVIAKVGEEKYNQIILEKANLEEKYKQGETTIAKINNNTELMTKIKSSLGEKFSIYVFSLYTSEEITFKVFEWVIETENGAVTKFENGTLGNQQAFVKIGQDIVPDFLAGADSAVMIEWVKSGSIKIQPASMVAKALPLISSISEIA